jgi:hypothetical protein
MKYASKGDLHKYLQKNFTNITWNKQKILILSDISRGYVYFIFINYILKFRLLIFIFLVLKLFIIKDLCIEISIAGTCYYVIQVVDIV